MQKLALICALLMGLVFAAALNAAPWDAESGAATLPVGYPNG